VLKVRAYLVGFYTFFSLIFGIVGMYLFPKKVHLLRKAWAWSMLRVIGVKINQHGTLDKNAQMLILNHNSMLDILLFEYLHPKEIAWVAKKSLAKIPFFGKIFLLSDLILVDTGSMHSFKNFLKKSQTACSQHKPIAIFPEGTRGDTDSMIPFQVGAKKVAEKLSLTVQPIILKQTRQRLDTKNFTASSGYVDIYYLPSITKREEDWYQVTEEKMRRCYEEES
jgi:1-acyl-sn-glycerol-3-phosphate acyltransferase